MRWSTALTPTSTVVLFAWLACTMSRTSYQPARRCSLCATGCLKLRLWKWYYAFQQVGDQTAEPLSSAYRAGQAQRDAMAQWSSFISPTTLLQRTIESLAGTDMASAIDYDQRVRDFHAHLRKWHYPRLFLAEVFDVNQALQTLPKYQPKGKITSQASASAIVRAKQSPRAMNESPATAVPEAF